MTGWDGWLPSTGPSPSPWPAPWCLCSFPLSGWSPTSSSRASRPCGSSFFFHDQRGVTPTQPATAGGGLHAIVGTIEQVGLALLISLPLGAAAAFFLNESRSRLRRPVRIFVDAMSGMPSIVSGLFIYATLIIPLSKDSDLFSFNGFMASLALSMTMMPTICRAIEVVLRLVPNGLREAGLALGASRAKVVLSVVLPTASTGVATAAILGIAREAGETAPLLFTAFGSNLMNANPFNGPQESLPLFIYRFVRTQSTADIQRGYAGALVLLLLILSLFVLARIIGRDRSVAKKRRKSPPAHPPAVRAAAHSAPVARVHVTVREPDAFGPRRDVTDLHLPQPEVTLNHSARSMAGPRIRTMGRSARPRFLWSRATAVVPTLIGGPPPGPAALEARDACAWFGDHLALEGVFLTMASGEVTALIGPSGCGKSTFLRLLNRMHELVPGSAMAGEILLDGEDIYGADMRAQVIRTRIGMVFQKPNPFPAMSIRQNVLSGLKLTKIRCSDQDALVEQSLQRAGLWREVRDRLGSPGGSALRWTTAAAVHCPFPRRGSERLADGRALLRPGPHLDPANRRDHHGAAQ